MEKFKQVFTSSTAKRFYWTTFAGFLGIVGMGLAGADWYYAPLVISLIAGLTKEINKKYSK